MAESLFHVRIVSPERPLFDGEAGSIVAMAHDGEVGLLPGHAALLSLLGTGVVRVNAAGGAGGERFAVRGGFLQVSGTEVTLLVTDAVRASDVNTAKVDQELAAVLAELRHPKSDEEYERLLDARRWAESRLAIAAPAA